MDVFIYGKPELPMSFVHVLSSGNGQGNMEDTFPVCSFRGGTFLM